MDISRTMGSVSEDPVELSAQIRIGADLITSSQQHLEFLKTVHSHPSLYGGLVLQRAIRRYVQFWLPLAAEYNEETLAAPLDIEWVWHCHMLSPTLYHTDLMKICGTIIRHKVSDKRNYEQALAFSETYWKRKYPEQPFQVSFDTLVDITESGSQEGEVSRSLGLQYDLEAAAGRQKAFYYQVSLPHYEDEKFLLGALKRYKKFLYLKQLTPNTFLVPCYDIDLMWHTHMNFPRIYKEDTTALLGKTLNHDDSVNDRTPGSKLDRTTMNTRVLWKRTYNEKFSNFGAMYRGESQSPEANLYQIADCEKFALFSKNTKISFDRIHLNERDKASKKFKLQIIEKDNIVIANKGSRSDIVDCSDALLTLKGPPCGWENAGSILKKLNCIGSNNIYIEVKPCKSLFGLSNSKKSKKLEAKIDLETISHKLTCLKKPATERAQLELDNKERVTLDMTLTPESLGGCTLWLYPGLFKDCVMPVESEQLWGPVMLPKLPPNVENKCSVASHK